MRTGITFISAFVALTSSAIASAQESGPQEMQTAAAPLFVTSDQCIACHSGMHTSGGKDVSIGYAWRASMMANAARDPYWHAAVRREVMDHPEAQAAIEDKCSTCHMPMDRFTQAQRGAQGRVFANVAALVGAPNALASDGVSCTVCHQIHPGNFGAPASYDGGFQVDAAAAPEQRKIYGPHAVDAGRRRIMQSAVGVVPEESTHLRASEMCATCHTLFTSALDEAGNEVGELAEQVPYLEWLHSAYRETNSCQSCHMPELAEETPISSVLGEPRPQFSEHVFLGGNAFMLGILNKHRGELGIQALPQEIEMVIERTRAHLATSTARLSIESAQVRGRELVVDLLVSNRAGHKLPTAYPSRRVWLHVKVTDPDGRTVFESGAPRADGSIAGNDNDSDAARYERHYEAIESADQVQIYEPILVDSRDRVTTGLLSGVRYAKDNRILPTGFDKVSADEDVAVRGAAVDDGDFTGGGDRIRYRVPLVERAGSVTFEARLLYQAIGFRWAENLKAYDSPETNRFVGYYEGSAASSIEQLAFAERHVRY
jgi:hypothetical protein